MLARIPLILDPQPEGGYTVTSPLLPELITEGDTIAECLANAEDAFAAVLEIYEDARRPLPPDIQVDDGRGPVSIEAVAAVHGSRTPEMRRVRILSPRMECRFRKEIFNER